MDTIVKLMNNFILIKITKTNFIRQNNNIDMNNLIYNLYFCLNYGMLVPISQRYHL